jgi:hypothetical protein
VREKGGGSLVAGSVAAMSVGVLAVAAMSVGVMLVHAYTLTPTPLPTAHRGTLGGAWRRPRAAHNSAVPSTLQSR